MSLDLDFDPLRKFLNSVSTVVNQHAQMINGLLGDVRTKITEIPVSDCFQRIGDSTMLFDADFNKIVALEIEKPRPEQTGKALEESTNRLSNRATHFGHAITWLFKKHMASEAKIAKMEGDLANKVDRTEFKAKIKKTKAKLRKLIADNYATLEAKITELDKKTADRMKTIEKKISEVEVSTVWRIKDCEDLLKTRVNDQYVCEAIKTLEEKLLKEMLRITEGNSENILNMHTELKLTVDRLLDDYNDKSKRTKTKLDELEDAYNER